MAEVNLNPPKIAFIDYFKHFFILITLQQYFKLAIESTISLWSLIYFLIKSIKIYWHVKNFNSNERFLYNSPWHSMAFRIRNDTTHQEWHITWSHQYQAFIAKFTILCRFYNLYFPNGTTFMNYSWCRAWFSSCYKTKLMC